MKGGGFEERGGGLQGGLEGGLKGGLKEGLKGAKLKQDAITKQKKKTPHEIALRGFSHDVALWKVLRRKENESKLK